ncbi:MAG TPA: hypothetical protein DCQ83_03240 [Fibrobacteres bacterium]|jgi:hypothetical protein|nr:hypothetical protein [Fibrobacterota bacterium]
MILFLLAFIASLLGGFASPWWWPAIVGLALGLWKPEPRSVLFSATSCGAALAWGGVAAFYQIGNHGLLGGRIAELFSLPSGWWLVLISTALGGVTAGIGAEAGRYLRLAYNAK